VTVRPQDEYPLEVQIRRVGAAVEQQTTFYVPAPEPGQTYTLPFASDADLATISLDGPAGPIAPTGTTTGDTSADGNPPTTIAGGTITPAGMSSVQLLATDDASGVGASYVVGADPTPTRYAGPFDVPLYSTVTFLSVDRQGNVENPQSIVADDAPGDRALAAPIAVGAKLDRTIWPQGDEDWFRFDADGTSTYRAQLYGLTSDYDLELVDSRGTVLEAPNTRSTASEEVRGLLPAGTYYLHVVGVSGAADRDHPYKLKLQVLGSS
jgi:pre-peptidase